MAGFFVTVTGNRGVPVGGFKETNRGFTFDPSKSKGVEMHPFSSRILCREGNEPSESAIKGTRCSSGNHQVKEGSPVYNIGVTHVCRGHLHLVPTIEELKRKFAYPCFINVSIEKEKKE